MVKRAGILLAIVILLLIIPFVAMQLTDEVQWSIEDFIIMGALLFGTGTVLDLVIRSTGKYKIPFTVLIILLFLYVWAELAVGIFTHIGS